MRATVRERLTARLTPCTAKRCPCRGCPLIPAKGRYAQISVNGKPQLAHRVAWELEHGPISPGLDIDHVYDRGCRHKNCANVAHLEPVTRAENIRRMDIANNGREHRLRPVLDGPIPPPSPEAIAAIERLGRYLSGP